MAEKNCLIILVSPPQGEPTLENFKLAEAPIPAIGRANRSQDQISFARPLYAGPHERGEILCAAVA